MNVFDPFYDPSDLSACVEASSSVAELNARAEKDGIYFPLWRDASQSLGSLYLDTRVCSRSFRFGWVGDNVMGARFRLSNGRTLEMGGRVVKNVVGFDLVRFLAGSQGRMGAPETLVLRLRPLPEVRKAWSVCGDLGGLEAFRKKFMLSPWVHGVDAFDFDLTGQGQRIGLAYACTRPEEAVYERAISAMSQGLHLEEEALPCHAVKPAAERLVPLSHALSAARQIQSAFGGRVSGFLGQGTLCLEPELPLPAEHAPEHPDLESGLKALLESIP